MKKTIIAGIFVCVCAFCAIQSVYAEKISGFGAVSQRGGGYVLDITGFSEIDLEDGRCDVIVTQGNEFRVFIDDEYADRAKISRSGRKVTFDSNRSLFSFAKRGVIEITCPAISELSVSGASNVDFSGTWQFNDVDLSISGSGSLRFNRVYAKEFAIESSGNGDISGMVIECNDFVFEASGNSHSSFTELHVGSADFHCSGSGSVSADRGYVTGLRLEASGSGKVDLRNVNVKNASVKMSGSGVLYLTVSDMIVGKMSGAASLYYRGNPKLDISTSGSVKVQQYEVN